MHLLADAEINVIGPIEPRIRALVGVQTLADLLHASTDEERGLAWHHVLLTTANFKAQIKVFGPISPTGRAPMVAGRGQVLQVPVGSRMLTVAAEDALTGQDLEAQVRGLGIPRTTTVLAVL